MRITKWFLAASCLTVFGLLVNSCAPAAAPAPTVKAAPTTAPAPTPAAKTAPTTAPAAAPTAKPAGPAPTAKPAADQARYGGILTIGIGGDPPTLDTHQEETLFSHAITLGAYNGLLKADAQAWPKLKVVSDLAASWDISSDGKVYTFHVVKGAKFHDGSPVTAEDVKFSLDRIRDPQKPMAKSPRKQQIASVSAVDAPDDATVRVTLSFPQASFVPTISTPYFVIMPKKVVLAKNNDMTKTVLGSGPFKFKSYSSGVGWELEKNSDYFVKGRPYLDGLKGYVILDGFTRFAALRTRNILWWTPNPYMSVSQTKVIEEQLSDKIALGWGFHPAWYGAMFNVSRAPWNDARVRQAVSMAFDRKKMLATGLEGAGVVGMAAQPPGEWALPEDEMNKVPGYAKPDIEGAKKLLAEAGHPNGLKAEMVVRNVKPHQDVAVLVKDAASAIGVDLDLKILETAIYNATRLQMNYGIIGGGAGIPLMDPDTQLGDYYKTGSSRNWTGYSNPRFDELLTKQAGTVDTAERLKIVYEMQRMLLKDVPIAIAYWVSVPYAWWKEVRNFYPPVGMDNAFQYQDIWMAK